MKQVLLWGCVLLALSIPGACRAREMPRDFAGISAKLFPETRRWTVVSKMDRAGREYLLKHREELNEAYTASGIGRAMESAGACSLMERAFSPTYDFPEGFYVHDVDLDGRMDVIYASFNPCGEGCATILWFGTAKGFVIRQRAIDNVLALRVREGNPPRFAWVSVACCDGQIDDYSVGTSGDSEFDAQKKRSVDIRTLEPIDEEKQPAPLQGTRGEPNSKRSVESNAAKAPDYPPDYSRISALLFPETKSWTLVSAMKPPDEAYLYLRANEAKLKEAYPAKEIRMDADRSGACALMERLFSSKAPCTFPYGFYVHDFDRDSRLDVMYAGPAECGEGNITIVWFATKDGFVIKQRRLGNNLALRVKDGNPPRMSFVSVGCCGDPIDVYSISTIADAPVPGGKRVVVDLRLAPRDEKAVPFAAGDTGFVLRSSPAIDNADRREYGEAMLGFPVFGNIMGKYPSGCAGKVVGRHVDAKSQLWYFVTLDRSPDSLGAHDGFDASAGWVEAAAVSLKK
jgi:hypothetical protein